MTEAILYKAILVMTVLFITAIVIPIFLGSMGLTLMMIMSAFDAIF